MNQISLLRASVLWPVLGITLLCVGLAAFSVTQQFMDPKQAGAYSPRLFAFLFLPAEFLIYDLIQGNPDPRLTFKRLWLDWRFARLLWAGAKAGLALGTPAIAVMMLLVALTGGMSRSGKLSGPETAMLVVGGLLVLSALLYFSFRFIYLSLAVARRDPRPVRSSFHETKGRIWKISWALFLPYAAIFSVTLAMELLGPVLERNLGLAGLAPWFLLDACLTGFLCCLSAAVLAFSHQRLIVADATTEALSQEPGQA